MQMLFRLSQTEKEHSATQVGTKEACGCLGSHLAYAEATRSALKTRCAFIGSCCSRCGAAYWTFLDSARMTKPEDIPNATKTKPCGEAELRDIAYEWILRAFHLGIPKNAIEVHITTI